MEGKQQSVLLGGAVVALLSTSYLSFINCLCCLGVIAGAMVAVWHYTSTNSLTVAPGEGAVMGLTAALLGTVVAVILNYALLNMGIRHDLALTDSVMELFRGVLDPEQYEDLVAERDTSIHLGPYLLSSLLSAAIASVFGAVGGAIGAAMFKKGGAPDEEFGGATI